MSEMDDEMETTPQSTGPVSSKKFQLREVVEKLKIALRNIEIQRHRVMRDREILLMEYFG